MPLSDLWADVDPDAPSPKEIDDSEKTLRKKLQTAPARVAIAQKRAAASQQQFADDSSNKADFSTRLQAEFFTQQYQRGHHIQHSKNPSSSAFTDRKQQFGRERARCVFSLLKCTLQKLVALFDGREVCHVVNTCIADDTSTKLRAAQSDRAVVHTIMNTVQNLFVRYGHGNDNTADTWESIHLPTPAACLESSRGDALHAAFTSWLVTSLSGPGVHWQRLGCPQDILARSKWSTCILVGDALKANDTAWRHECRILAQDRQDPNSSSHKLLGIRMKCTVHQLALVRKPAVLSIDKYWTTLVRLGHLYETYSFRRALGAALISLLQREGQFIRALDCSFVYLCISSGICHQSCWWQKAYCVVMSHDS